MFPIHLNLGFRVFYYYEGFYFLAAVVVGYLIALKRLGRAGQDRELLAGSLLWILLGAVVGARIFHFLFWDWGDLRAHPGELFRVWDGGLSITGGLAGGVLAAVVCLRRHRADIGAWAAALCPAVLVAQAVGRVGCFLNGDAWGIPTRLPWGIREPRFGMMIPGFRVDTRVPSAAWEWCVARGFIPANAMATVPLHPTQLYEALGDLALAGLVVLLVRRLGRTGGRPLRVLWLHLGGYSLLRFGLEFLHGDREELALAGMTVLQLGLLACALLGLALLAWPGPAGAGRTRLH
jgi:phosphatidylglycerol:prolipoprotein diacylglycerol transferase